MILSKTECLSAFFSFLFFLPPVLPTKCLSLLFLSPPEKPGPTATPHSHPFHLQKAADMQKAKRPAVQNAMPVCPNQTNSLSKV